MLNSPSYYYLWDYEESKYIKNDFLVDLSMSSYLGINKVPKQVVSTYRADGHHSTYYSCNDDKLLPVWYEGILWEKDVDEYYKSYHVKEVYENEKWVEVERK